MSIQHCSAKCKRLLCGCMQVVAYAIKLVDWSEPAHPKISSDFVAVTSNPRDQESRLPRVEEGLHF